jgi:hypothetical protein
MEAARGKILQEPRSGDNDENSETAVEVLVEAGEWAMTNDDED